MTAALAPVADPPGAPAAPSVGGPSRRRVAVVTASYGAGHDRAAAALAAMFRAAGDHVDVLDAVALAPAGAGRLARRVYYTQLRCLPGTWGATLRHLEPGMTAHTAATSALRMLTRPLVRAVEGADLVVTTHPFASQALGHARARGLLRTPVVTYLTDASVHPLWVHPAVDLHAALHEVAAAQARRWGGRTVVVRPALTTTPPAPAGPRLLPVTGHRYALLTGGSLGFGSLEASVSDVLACPRWTPVVLCGTNRTLRRRLGRRPEVIALGWRDDVPALMRDADCVLDNAGGFSSLEALASGTPVVSYRPLAGHGQANAEAMERAGLAPYVREAGDLLRVLDAMAVAPRVDRLPSDGPRVCDAVASLVAVPGRA